MPDLFIAPGGATQALTERSLDLIEKYWGEASDEPFPRDQLRNSIAHRCAMRPPCRRIGKAVATHEAGHFLALWLEGFGAPHAKIYNRGYGWYGVTASPTTPCLNNPHDLVRRARITLAGPLAEELLGEQCASNKAADHIEELLRAAFVVDRAATLWGQSTTSLWQPTVIEAAAFVDFWSEEIRDIAAVLARRKTIHAQDQPIQRILARVSAKSLTIWKFSPRCMDILTSMLPLASLEK